MTRRYGDMLSVSLRDKLHDKAPMKPTSRDKHRTKSQDNRFYFSDETDL